MLVRLFIYFHQRHCRGRLGCSILCVSLLYSNFFPHYQLSGIIISASMVDSPYFGRIFTQCSGYMLGGAMVFLIGFKFPSAVIVVLAYMSRLSIMAASVCTSTTRIATSDNSTVLQLIFEYSNSLLILWSYIILL